MDVWVSLLKIEVREVKEYMNSHSFKDLQCWNKAHEFVLHIYKITGLFPKSELYALNSQFRRAVISIPTNIAEGYKKTGVKDKLRFFNIAQGSIEESRYYIILAKDLNYIESEKFDLLNELLESSSRLLNVYCNKISQSIL